MVGNRAQLWLSLDNVFTIRFLSPDFTQELQKSHLITHSRYHGTTAHTKSSNHTLSLHGPASNSSSTMNFPWPSSPENWLTRSADCLQDNCSVRTPRKTPSSSVKDACLQLRCLARDVLLFREFARRGPHRKQFPLLSKLLRNLATDCLPRIWLRGNLFTNPLPGNALTCHSIYSVLSPSHPLLMTLVHLYTSQCYSLSNILNTSNTSPFLGPNIRQNFLPNICNLCSSLRVTDHINIIHQVSHGTTKCSRRDGR
jgi:hypothetical protein